MADQGLSRQMSLVPYASAGSREIVLQQGRAVVIYDNQSKSLSVRHDADIAQDETECPYCHRPYHEDATDNAQHFYGDSARTPREQSFVDPEYFRMLAQSQRSSPLQSGVDTPFTSAVPRALRSGRSREVSGSQPPPTEAEFVASEPNPENAQGISSSAFSPGYFKQLFREERELGRGGNGVVLLVEHVLDGFSLGKFACKRIPVGNDHRWLEKVLVEVKLLTQVSHTNLVKYHWVWVEEHQPSTFGPRIPCVWILQQFCNAGDLQHYVTGPTSSEDTAEYRKARYRRRSTGKLTPVDVTHRQSKLTLEEIFSFFKDITSGLHHLHSKGYIHRDVKPSNCLLHTDQGRTRVLLSDFGEVQAAGTRRVNTGATGTISYCAPEVLQMDDANGRFGDFTTKSDIFSLGMIVYFMCFGRLPYDNAFDGHEDEEDLDLLRAEIMSWQGFEDVSRLRPDLPDRLYKYLQRLLSVDPLERPSTDEILHSIKANGNLGDVPTRRSSRSTKMPFGDDKPNLPRFDRKLSGAVIDRSLSPTKRSRGATVSATAEAPISAHHERGGLQPGVSDSVPTTPRRQSPILMLPPPPPTSMLTRAFRSLRDPSTLSLARSGILILKITTLMTSCTPFAPRAVVLYPLLLLALLEPVFLELQLAATALTLLLHVLAIWLVREYSTLCEGAGHASAAFEVTANTMG